MICDVYDNILDSDVAQLIDTKMREMTWSYDYHSDLWQKNKHWHRECGRGQIEPEHSFLEPIWETIRHNFQQKYRIDSLIRIYCNAHTHGIEPHVHSDDGDFTMIYYPRLDWKPWWLGGTAIWNQEKNQIEKYVNYIGNRLLVFDAKLFHQAMAVSRQCYELRTCVVFKTQCN